MALTSARCRAVIEGMFPPGVAVATRSGRGRAADALYPEERTAIRRAVPARRAEFQVGRECAREALTVLGFTSQPIGVGPNREPLWPGGIVGSITHCEGLTAAVVAEDHVMVTLGVDAEPARPLPSSARELILSEPEMFPASDELLETVIFCAKEALHKAIFPLTSSYMEFLDVRIHLDVEVRSFRAHTTVGSGPAAQWLDRLQGRFAIDDGFVVTGAYLPVEADANELRGHGPNPRSN